jgi:hypothetical protein
MRRWIRYVAATCLALVTITATTRANHNADSHLKMSLVATSGNQATNSDLAFWGNHAFVGYYTGSTGFPPGTGARGGVRIFDISDPNNPSLVRDFACDGAQNDLIVWDRNGNGVADLLLVAVDSTMASPDCGAPRVAGGTPTGWEGVRVFTMSDDPANPFATVTPVDMQYTDCGAHTITAWPGAVEDVVNPRLLVYVSSYPLLTGPTCGDTEFANTANPYDEDPPTGPLHGVIQVLEVPLANPAATREIASPRIIYPGDPDGRMEWCERGLCAGVEPAAIACTDITVHVEQRLAAAACGEQAQIWQIDENGIPDTQNPLRVVDDEVSSGGTGDIPGAVDFFDSAAFSNRGDVVNFVDDSFGAGCPPATNWSARPWNPAGGRHNTGRMFFLDAATGELLSEFQVGNVRPDAGAGAYCSAGRGAVVRSAVRDVLVNAWFTGDVNVLDFTNPRHLREIAHYDFAVGGGQRSAYSYSGPSFPGGHPVYAADGVMSNANAKGLVIFKAVLEDIARFRVGHLNPQTID